MIRRGLIIALACLVPAAAGAQNVAEVQVAPPTVTIRVGERSGLLATAFDRIGNVIPTVRIIWSSNNVNVAKVDNSGTITGVANGVAIIEARVGARPWSVCRPTRGQWYGGRAAAGAGRGLSAGLREYARFAAGPAGRRLTGCACSRYLDITACGRGERRSERQRRGALAGPGHDPDDRYWWSYRDRPRRCPAGGVQCSGRNFIDALARRARHGPRHRR